MFWRNVVPSFSGSTGQTTTNAQKHTANSVSMGGERIYWASRGGSVLHCVVSWCYGCDNCMAPSFLAAWPHTQPNHYTKTPPSAVHYHLHPHTTCSVSLLHCPTHTYKIIPFLSTWLFSLDHQTLKMSLCEYFCKRKETLTQKHSTTFLNIWYSKTTLTHVS
jgi:hypothetical protein